MSNSLCHIISPLQFIGRNLFCFKYHETGSGSNTIYYNNKNLYHWALVFVDKVEILLNKCKYLEIATECDIIRSMCQMENSGKMRELEAVKNVILHMNSPAMLVQDGNVIQWNESAEKILRKNTNSENAEIPSCVLLPEHGGAVSTELVEQGERYCATAWDIGPATVVTLQPQNNTEVGLRGLGSVSGSIRQPLAGIYACTRILMNRLDRVADTQTDEYSSAMVKNLYQLMRLAWNIDALGQYSLLSEQKPDTFVEVSQFLSDLVEECRPYASVLQKKIEYDGPGRSVSTYLFPGKLRLALLNLLANALEHTQKGGVVRVRLVISGKTLAISVIDDGCGISPEKMQHISEQCPDRRCDDMPQNKAGIGLPLARIVANLHGGTMVMESRPEHGTTVTMALNLRANESDTLHALKCDTIREEYLQPKVAFSALLPTECYMFEEL